jgi:hypothetical protein
MGSLYTFPRRLVWRRWQPNLSKLSQHFYFDLVRELSDTPTNNVGFAITLQNFNCFFPCFPHIVFPPPASSVTSVVIYGILMDCNVYCWLAVLVSYIQERLFQPDSHGPLFVSGAWNRRIKLNGIPNAGSWRYMTCKNNITEVISTEFHFTVQRAIFFRENNRTCHIRTHEEIASQLCRQVVWEKNQQCESCNEMEHMYI